MTTSKVQTPFAEARAVPTTFRTERHAGGTKVTPIVCQLLHSLKVGGAELLASHLARRLEHRCRFLFVCLDEEGSLGRLLRQQGFPVHVLGRQPGVDWRCVIRLSQILTQEKVDLIHAHQYSPFFYGMTARLMSRWPPVLFTEHGRFFPDRRRPRRVLVNRLLLQRQDSVVGVGQWVRRALIENEGIPPGRVRVIYNGVETAHFAAAPSERASVRRELGLGPNHLAIVQVARLDPIKDHASALRATERVATRVAGLRLFLVGDGPARAGIEEQVRQRGLGSYVHLLGTRTDVPRLLQAADIALLTSLSEGIPLTLIEAMAAGLPVVSTCVGGVEEVVVDGQQGFLVEPGNDAAIADGVLRLADAPDLRAAMGQRGRERAFAFFSEERMCADYLRLYQEMLTKVARICPRRKVPHC